MGEERKANKKRKEKENGGRGAIVSRIDVREVDGRNQQVEVCLRHVQPRNISKTGFRLVDRLVLSSIK